MPTVTTSEDFRRNAAAQECDDPQIVLVSITAEGLDEPLRASSDMTQRLRIDEATGEPLYGTPHGGNEYPALPYYVVLPDQPSDGSAPRARIGIKSVDQSIVRGVRETAIAPGVDIRIVQGSNLEQVEYHAPSMLLKNVKYNATSVEGELVFDHTLDEPCPPDSYSPSRYRGLL
ncbi:hypothetical protein [Nitratidesulfovibrio liaohensis]|uniref:Uncharacterized protein n=1 Tax=Nitratidesulfovibrio liaohensis TaxID=2604158 RepID=A0ABY9QY15_9BACT|nr:hypothetical protein [Nitratidesulfovibrio liaohensis]WMW64389.1 hypothetical protein KPS_002401 [Nitratidesulfovibrio liaohensis]